MWKTKSEYMPAKCTRSETGHKLEKSQNSDWWNQNQPFVDLSKGTNLQVKAKKVPYKVNNLMVIIIWSSYYLTIHNDLQSWC
jgi:hypothetical protein